MVCIDHLDIEHAPTNGTCSDRKSYEHANSDGSLYLDADRWIFVDSAAIQIVWPHGKNLYVADYIYSVTLSNNLLHF